MRRIPPVDSLAQPEGLGEELEHSGWSFEPLSLCVERSRVKFWAAD